VIGCEFVPLHRRELVRAACPAAVSEQLHQLIEETEDPARAWVWRHLCADFYLDGDVFYCILVPTDRRMFSEAWSVIWQIPHSAKKIAVDLHDLLPDIPYDVWLIVARFIESDALLKRIDETAAEWKDSLATQGCSPQ